MTFQGPSTNERALKVFQKWSQKKIIEQKESEAQNESPNVPMTPKEYLVGGLHWFRRK